MLKKINYPVSKRALEKWVKTSLRIAEDNDRLFIYDYEGSTCKDGGTPFRALFYTLLSDDMRIKKAWIEIPESEKAAAGKMCGRDYEGWTGYEGEKLENVILEKIPLNYAGCLCRAPMINQKWKMALSTVHYYLSEKNNQ